MAEPISKTWHTNDNVIEGIRRAASNLEDLTTDIDDFEDGESYDLSVTDALSSVQKIVDTLQEVKQELRRMRNG